MKVIYSKLNLEFNYYCIFNIDSDSCSRSEEIQMDLEVLTQTLTKNRENIVQFSETTVWLSILVVFLFGTALQIIQHKVHLTKIGKTQRGFQITFDTWPKLYSRNRPHPQSTTCGRPPELCHSEPKARNLGVTRSLVSLGACELFAKGARGWSGFSGFPLPRE